VYKNRQTTNFKKGRSVEVEMFHADRQTDGEAWRSQ